MIRFLLDHGAAVNSTTKVYHAQHFLQFSSLKKWEKVEHVIVF